MKLRTTIMILALCLGISMPAGANPLPWEKDQGPSRGNGEKIAKRIKAKRAELIRTRIGLDEAQSEEVLATLERFDERRRELMEKKRNLGQTMDRLFQSDSADDAEYQQVIAGLQSMEDAMHRLRSEQASALGEVVSPRFQLRILVALKRFQRRLHKRRHEHMKSRADKRRGADDERRRRGSRKGRGGW